MSLPQEATRSLMSRRTESPRTILAFHATVIGILLTFDLGVVVSLATTGAADWLIPWVLAIGFGCAVVYAIAVFRVAKDDPSKLMLGQVTGHEYAEIQRVVLGDSSTGERTAPVIDAHVIVEQPASATIAMEHPFATKHPAAQITGERPEPEETQEGGA